MSDPVFTCRMCGHCCYGEGGIIVSPKDLQRLCAFLAIDTTSFTQNYASMHNGKLKVRNGNDGKCIFFAEGVGCRVHEGRPDICRAWPFFRGNMLDAESLFLAKDFCPGIRATATHEEFVKEGLHYLQEHDLEAHDAKTEAHALLPITQTYS